jgi:Na+/H+-translocating membrane pyrophosphatase
VTLATITTLAFLLGAVCSSMAGYVGMWVSVRANVRVAGAARRTAREALQIALRAGGFSGLMVVALTVLGVTILFSVFYVLFGVGEEGNLDVNDGANL